MSEFYNQDEDPASNYKDDHTWKDDHVVGKSRVRITNEGVNKFSNNMGHGPLCPDCSSGVLEEQATDLNRDGHFKRSMEMHNSNLGKND